MEKLKHPSKWLAVTCRARGANPPTQEIIRRLEQLDGSTLVAKQVPATMGRTLTIMRNDLARLSIRAIIRDLK